MAGHELVGLQEEPPRYRFTLARGEPAGPPGRRVALVISSAGLLDLLSPLGFALAAALAGAEVSIYFQGPGVRVLREGFEARLPGLGWLFSGLARREMAATGHLPPQEKLRQLHQLGGRFFACGPSMQRFGVPREKLAFDDVTVAEYFTFVEQMQGSGILLYPQ
jgi:predicted peroxiredoxin